MGKGLKDQWGVTDPAKAGSDKQAQEFQATFKSGIACINGHLQYTSANGEPALHAPLEARRDALYSAFQAALAQIDPTDPSKAKGAIDGVLADSKALSGEAAKFRAEAEKAKNGWQPRQPKYDAAVHQVEELEAWGDAKAAPLRALVDGIRTQVNEHRYAPASTTVDQLLPKLKPIFDEYQKQKVEKPKYEQGLAEKSARLDALKALEKPSQPMTAKAGEADTALGQAKAKADGKDYVGACEGLKTVQTAVDALDKLAKDPQRAKFLADIKAVEEQVKPPEGTVFKSQEADWSAISQLKDQTVPAADSGDYAGANKMLMGLKPKLDAFKKKHDELEQQKKAYEDALAGLQPKLTGAAMSESQYVKIAPMQQDMAAVQTQMETAAQSEDFVKALELEKDLATKVDAYERAKAELDQQKQKYEDALAGVQPRLQAASLSEPQYSTIQPKQQEMSAAHSAREAAAQAFDYEKAMPLLQALTVKLEAYEAAKAEVDKQKAAYEAALGTLTPKIADVNKKQYLDLISQQQEIAKGQQEMAATAAGSDYVKALQQSNDLTVKVEAYIAAAAKEVEPPILGSAQSERSDAMLKKLPAADQEKVKKLMTGAKSEAEKQYLLKGVASGHSVTELQEFATKIQGKDATWMRDHLSLTSSSTGTGVKQQWSMSCNATTVEAVKGQMDPLYALKMHEENPDLDKADEYDGTKTNPKLAKDQKAMLTSDYKGGVAGAGTSGGDAVARKSGQAAGGRWADDLLNNNSDTTGITYSTKQIGGTTTVSDAVTSIDAGTSKGQPVPIVIGDGAGSPTAHYVLVTGSDPGPPKRYTIHDPASGTSVVRTENDLKNGTINLAGWNQIGAYEAPATKEVK